MTASLCSTSGTVERQQRLPGVFLRGMAMGAADIVPGVSGGTIAFITGIYFRLLEAINNAPMATFRYLLKGRPGAFWQAIDGGFLLTLLAGIVTSIATLATLITWLLAEHPIWIWSFFFGLILASVWHVSLQVRRFRLGLVVPLLAGIVIAWYLTTLPASEVAPSGLVFLGAGALAICAMILPGVSGSFLLLIIGMYGPVLSAVKAFEVASLALFLAGCVLGLLSAARVITLAFRHFHDTVLVLLTGFMIGALTKVWPWQETLSWRTNSSGEQVPLNQTPITPAAWESLYQQDALIIPACFMALSGLALVLILETVARKPAGQA